MIRHTCLRIALACFCLVGSAFAQSAEDHGSFSSAAQVDRLSDDELSEQRGGFSWQGLDVQFGAEIRSYIGDELVMLTNVTWTGAANEVQRTVSDSLTEVPSDQLGTMFVNGLQIRPGSESVFVANQGQTAFIQRTDGVIQNIIANVASNVDLRQEVDVKLDIANYGPFQDSILASRIGAALSAMSGLELSRAAPH